MTDWIDDYMKMTKNSEPPDSYRLWTAISTIAAVLERKVWMKWQELIYPNMYIVLVGPPSARKSFAMGQGEDFLFKLKDKINLAPNSSTFPDLAQRLASSKKKFTTPDGGLHSHNSLTAFSKEMLSLLRKGDDLESIVGFFIECFDCKFYEKGTKTQGTDRIEAPWFNWLAGIQPDTLRSPKYFPSIAKVQGLLSRMVFVVEHKMQYRVLDPRETKEEGKLKGRLLTRLKKINELTGEFHVSDCWVEAWKEWYSKYPMSVGNARLAHYAARKPLYIQKLCIVCSASRSLEMTITAEDFNRAMLILSTAEKRMPEAFEDNVTTNYQEWYQGLTAEVMSHIDIAGELSYSDLFQKVVMKCKEKDLLQVLNSLVKTNKIALEAVQTSKGLKIDKETKIRWLRK
jgi:hypothetical protein